ncbi:MAG: flagellar hook-associated protein FlgL [Gemmatimonadaceae bacterium]
MRVTSNMATQNAIASIAAARERMDTAQVQLTTGHRVQSASEDPSAASVVMQNDSQLRAITQYQRNVGNAKQRANLEEGALDQLTSLLNRAREITISQAGDTASPATRQAAGAEVNQLLAQAVQLADTKIGDEYLFGGNTSGTPPFSVDASTAVYSFSVAATAPAGARQVEIGAGQLLTANHDGTQVFGTTSGGALKALQDLSAALQTGSGAAVSGLIPTFVSEVANVQTLIGVTGARANQMDITAANLTALTNQLITFNSNLQDVDMEAAITELTGRQTAYQAAMAVTARLSGLSLADYLR